MIPFPTKPKALGLAAALLSAGILLATTGCGSDTERDVASTDVASTDTPVSVDSQQAAAPAAPRTPSPAVAQVPAPTPVPGTGGPARAPMPGVQKPYTVDVDGAQVGHWTHDLDAAKALAMEKELPLLINFTGSDWCGVCLFMDETVFGTKAWKQYAEENLVLAYIDFPQNVERVPQKYRARNTRLDEEFDPPGYPTYYLLDTDGSTEIASIGVSRNENADVFIRKIKAQLRMRDSAVAARVESYGDVGPAYLEAVNTVKSTTNELMAYAADMNPRDPEAVEHYYELIGKIDAANREVIAIEVRQIAADQEDPQDKDFLLRSLKDYLDAKKELDDFLATKPNNSQENMAIFNEIRTRIQTTEAVLNRYRYQ